MKTLIAILALFLNLMSVNAMTQYPKTLTFTRAIVSDTDLKIPENQFTHIQIDCKITANENNSSTVLVARAGKVQKSVKLSEYDILDNRYFLIAQDADSARGLAVNSTERPGAVYSLSVDEKTIKIFARSNDRTESTAIESARLVAFMNAVCGNI